MLESSGLDFDKAAVRCDLGLDGLHVTVPPGFDDPAYSREVLGLRLEVQGRHRRAVVDMTQAEIREMAAGRMAPEHDHLNTLLEGEPNFS